MFSEMDSSDRILVPQSNIQFNADHPFFFAVKNKDDIVFNGRYIEV